MLTRRHDRGRSSGFTVVELLVVLLLLGIVSSVVAGGLIRGQRADAQAQARIAAFEEMQIALERVSREVRAASTPLPDDVLDEDGEWLQVDVLREGICIRFTFEVGADDALRVSEQRSTDDCDNFGTATDRVLVPDLADPAVFTFETNQYDDGERIAATDARDIRFVTITFTRTLFEQQPVTVSTVVGLRNAS